MESIGTCTAFSGDSLLASGPLCEVAVAVKRASIDQGEHAPTILVFDDRTGRQIDFDLRGSDEEIALRLVEIPEDDAQTARRSPGRPKLGVVAREVTLLPRHWKWLADQPGGASGTLRRMIDTARSTGRADEQVRSAREAADCFMSVMLGNQLGYEEASRALYRGDAVRFREIVKQWPADLREHALRLAEPSFV